MHGTINFRKRVMLLGPENMKILGGNVENITTSAHFVDCIEYALNEKRSNETTMADREKVKNFEGTEIRPAINQTKQIKTEYQSQNCAKSQSYNKFAGGSSTKQAINSRMDDEDDDDEDALLMSCNLNQLEKEKNHQKAFGASNNNNNKIDTYKTTSEIYHSFQYNANQASSKIKRPPSTECISSLASNAGQPSRSVKENTNSKKPKIETIHDLEDLQDIIDDGDDDDDFKMLRAVQSAESKINVPSLPIAKPKIESKYLIEDLSRDQEELSLIHISQGIVR